MALVKANPSFDLPSSYTRAFHERRINKNNYVNPSKLDTIIMIIRIFYNVVTVDDTLR